LVLQTSEVALETHLFTNVMSGLTNPFLKIVLALA
jgi:hypothetical protein